MNLQINPIVISQLQQRTSQAQSKNKQDVNFKGVFTRLSGYDVVEKFHPSVQASRQTFLQRIMDELFWNNQSKIEPILKAFKERGLAEAEKTIMVYPNSQEQNEFHDIFMKSFMNEITKEEYFDAISNHAVKVIANATEITDDNRNLPEVLNQFIM